MNICQSISALPDKESISFGARYTFSMQVWGRECLACDIGLNVDFQQALNLYPTPTRCEATW